MAGLPLIGAELFADLQRLIPNMPAYVTEMKIELAVGAPVKVTATFWAEKPGRATFEPDGQPITKTYTLVGLNPIAINPGLSTAQAQDGPSA